LKETALMKCIISEDVFVFLLALLPDPKSKKTGRPKCSKEALLRGLIKTLKYDIPWNDLDIEGASGISCWRYFKKLQRRGLLKQVFQALVDEHLDIEISSIDSSTATSHHFKNGVGFSGKHKKYGTKISVLSDKNGFPYDIEFGKGSKHDLHFVRKHIRNTYGKRKRIINLDKGYTSIALRREMKQKGIYINMETRRSDYTHKKGPKFKVNKAIYSMRSLIEQKFGWLKAFRRVRTRKDHKFAMYKGFVYLAAIIVLIRSFEF
jgi:transposase